MKQVLMATVILAAMFASCSQANSVAHGETASDWAVLDQALATPSDSKVPAFNGAVLVARGNQVLFQRQLGLADRQSQAVMSADSQFVIGSLSKQITAVLVLEQVRQGRVMLDAAIGDYLPLSTDWRDKVTVRHLLNHTSGLRRMDKPLIAEPGRQFAYSNLGYDLLGQLVAARSGQPYHQLAAGLFARCGMTASFAPSVGRPQSTAGQLVSGYFESEPGTATKVSREFPMDSVPSGGIVSTAGDLLAWNLCLHGQKAIDRKVHRQMVNPGAVRPHRWGELGYGFGLQLSGEGEPREWSHSGYVPGYIMTMSYYPDADLSLIVLENEARHWSDMARVFYYHDALRQLLLARLPGKEG